MKLPALAVTAFTVAVFIGGTAAAQMAPAATMQPVPNPPETGASHGGKMHHHHGKMHHHRHMHHHMHVHHHVKGSSKTTAAPAAETPAPAPATPK